MTVKTKRVIMEQIDGEAKEPGYSNFDAFSAGFSEGFNLKSAAIIGLIMLITVVLLFKLL